MKKEKVCVLHGALSNTNFGDYLFGTLFYEKANDVLPDHVFIADMPKFGVNEVYRQEMNYYRKCGILNFLRSNTLVYISGGYFGEMTSDLKNALYRYFRYFFVGKIAMILNKKIIIIGVGGGPLNKKFLRNAACQLIQYADAVTFRDDFTLQYFAKYTDCSKVEVTCDTALVIDGSMVPPMDEIGEKEIQNVQSCSKKMLIHIADHEATDELMLKLVPSINRFLEDNPEYGVVFSYDGYEDTPIDNQKIISLIQATRKSVYHYHGVWQLCSLIMKMDCVITGKLHMGIVASRLGKSVISFPYNAGKVVRFYEQIHEAGRCRPLKSVTTDEINEMLKAYANESIIIPDSLLVKAYRNIEILQQELKT